MVLSLNTNSIIRTLEYLNNSNLKPIMLSLEVLISKLIISSIFHQIFYKIFKTNNFKTSCAVIRTFLEVKLITILNLNLIYNYKFNLFYFTYQIFNYD